MEAYRKVFALPHNLTAEGAPLCVLRGFLLYEVSEDRFLAQLRFKSLSPKEILSFRIALTEINANGIRYKGRVLYTYDRVYVTSDEALGDKTPIYLPHKGVRSFGVELIDVTFADGSVWTSDGTALAPCPAQVPLKTQLQRDAQIGWRQRYGKRAVYAPATHGSLWLCTCGTPHTDDAYSCTCCGAKRSEIFHPDRDALALEGYLHRIRTLIRSGDGAKLTEAEALITDAPEGIDRDACLADLNEARALYREQVRRHRRTVRISLGVGIPLFTAVLALSILFPRLIIPSHHYNAAMKLIEQEEYWCAYDELLECDGYSNSEDWIDHIETTVRDKTMYLFDQGDSGEALTLIRPFKEAGSAAFTELPTRYLRYFGGNGYGFDSAIWLEPGHNSYASSGDRYYFFVPETSGYYTFSSSSMSSESDLDGYLYDSDYIQLAGDISSGDFTLGYYLHAGEIYYFRVISYNDRYVTADIILSH